ncbi:proteasome maturation factor UMP1 [Lipomyces japonicus]|uniref:proteasome maturation factor UMP1 n=1 Tax=Lipomyces japonicus TaxID=56871 RepID=UPI0034CEACBA
MVTGRPPVPLAGKLNPASSSSSSAHPLETRLKQWEKTQFDLKLENLRRVFGTHEPVKRVMELEAISASAPYVPDVLKRADWAGANGAPGARLDVHAEILLGRDATVDWEDIYGGTDEVSLDFHTELERKMHI